MAAIDDALTDQAFAVWFERNCFDFFRRPSKADASNSLILEGEGETLAF